MPTDWRHSSDYARAGVPMLPVTHGDRFTRLHILLYTMILSAVCLMPLASGMSGTIYLISALALNGVFLAYAIRLYLSYSDRLARPPFAIRSFICLASSRHC
jgi:protoheme IX farnesyltransferase